jgi:hypothetical protein
MAATGENYSEFDTIIARHIWVKNDAGEFVVTLGAAPPNGNGLVTTQSAKGETVAMVRRYCKIVDKRLDDVMDAFNEDGEEQISER